MNNTARKLSILVFATLLTIGLHAQKTVFVAKDGNDQNPGTYNKPLASFEGAKRCP